MMELLFKLTKDGECAGYLLLEPVLAIKGIWFKRFFSSSWERCPQKIIDGDFDEARPFVCLDKNKKEVFKGDRIKRVNYTGDPQPREKAGREGIVVWHHGFLQWSLKVGSENIYDMEDLVDSEIFEDGIELIE